MTRARRASRRALALDVLAGVEEAAGDVGTTVEGFLAQEGVEAALQLLTAIAEGQADARGAIEDHDGEAVIISKDLQGLMRGRGNALDMRAHTAADVEQQDQVDRHVFAGEIADVAGLAGFLEEEILGSKSGDGAVAAIYHLGVDAGEGYVALEDNVTIGGGGREEAEGGGDQDRTGDAGHSTLPFQLAIR
jgi:hypothetical protein